MNEVTYKRELNHSYLVRKCGQPELLKEYAWRMMEENRIGRLLDCRQRFLDGETFSITTFLPAAVGAPCTNRPKWG